jgi:hypothetical protein
MPDTTLEKVIADIRSLSPEQQEELRRLLNGGMVTSQPVQLPITPRIVGTYPPRDRSREWDWLARHSDEYAGQWVAIDGDRLVSHGYGFKEVHAAARAAGVPDALIVWAERRDAPPYVGI